MTKIVYEVRHNEFEIDIKGHAGYAAAGNDIVCAAISILVQTLVQHLGNVAVDLAYKIDNGSAHIWAQGETAYISFRAILTGLEMLSEQYPDYVSLEEGCTMKTFEHLK